MSWGDAFAVERREDSLSNHGRIGLDLGFPEAEHSPTHVLEKPGALPVPLHVALDLREPVPGVTSSAQLLTSSRPIPAMPEVAVTEDSELLAAENDVRFSRQLRDVFSVPAPGGPQDAAERYLAARICLLAAGTSGRRGSV